MLLLLLRLWLLLLLWVLLFQVPGREVLQSPWGVKPLLLYRLEST